MSQTREPRSRRELLAAGLGAIGAVVAGAFGRPERIQAGGNIQVGGTYSAGVPTRLQNTTTTNTIWVVESKVNGTGTSILGTATHGTGVSGIAEEGQGVSATSTSGMGVHATSTSGYAVRASTTSSIGVYASSGSGVGVRASSSTGYALQTVGRLKIGTSGLVKIPANATSVTVHPGVDISATSFCLLTPTASLQGRDLYYTLLPISDDIVIHLSTSRTADTLVAWLLIG